MKTTIITSVLTALLLLTGCGKKATSTGPGNSSPSNATAVAQSSLIAWQQGDQAKAVTNFVETDWSARPLFASSSPLSLSEEQFKALSESERQAKSGEMLSQLGSLKQLGAAVAQAGREAASKGDTTQARKCFTALKQCGTALDSPDCLLIAQLVGRALKKMGDAELAKIPQ